MHIWNSLPNNYFNTQLIRSFKAKLSAFDFSEYLHGQLQVDLTPGCFITLLRISQHARVLEYQ